MLPSARKTGDISETGDEGVDIARNSNQKGALCLTRG